MTFYEPVKKEELGGKKNSFKLPEGLPPLRSLYLYMTDSCNMRCRHCWITPTYIEDKPSPGEYLELDLLKKAVAEAKTLGLGSVKLTGGEPVLHPQFVEIVDYLTAEKLSLDMETNGTLIDAVMARHLKDETNLNFVSVSIDGPNPEMHDFFRGVEGSFEAAVKGFKNLVAAGYRPQLIMSLYRGNIDYIEDVIILAAKLGAGSVKFNPVLRSGRGIIMHEHNETLSVEETVELAHRIRGPLQEQTKIELIISTPLPFYSVSEILNGAMGGMCHVRNILGILGSGEMVLCGIGRTIPELCFGNLADTSVRKVWLENPVLLKMRSDLERDYQGLCGQCIHTRRCQTYCVAQNYQETGHLVSTNPLCAQAKEFGMFPESRLKIVKSVIS